MLLKYKPKACHNFNRDKNITTAMMAAQMEKTKISNAVKTLRNGAMN